MTSVMKTLDILLSQIFISLEHFLQKTTTLNIFETLIFNYKIKVIPGEQISPQFISFVVDLYNELQAILHDNVTQQSDKTGTENTFCDLQAVNTDFDAPAIEFNNPPKASIQEEQNNEIWEHSKRQHSVISPVLDPVRDATPHQPQDSLKSIYSCELCKRKYQTQDKLSKHLCKSVAANEEKDEENADNPDSINADPSESPSQVDSEPQLPVFVCGVCFAAFRSKELFYNHSHSNAQDIELMTSSVQLRNVRKFSCSVCCEVYRSLPRISYHIARCHAGPYPCELCSHVFSTKHLLNNHKKKYHKGVESFFCSECGLGFKLRTSLQKHMVNRHETEQAFRCLEEGCGMVFSKKIKLTNHRIAEHGVERKFLCQVCGRKFMSQDSLSSHLESHTNAWKFQCGYCEKLFYTKEKLTFHVRTHTGERPFACDRPNCSKSFVSKSKLMEHLQRHRGEKRHKCLICGKQYANKPDLRSHLSKIHTQDSEEVNRGAVMEPSPQSVELYPTQVMVQVDNTSPGVFSNVGYYQDPLHVVRSTVALPVLTSYQSVMGLQ